MKFGLYAINYGTCADPDSLVRVAQHAEAAGLASLWAGEHIVLPSPQPPDYAIAPEIPFLDAVVALALAAANTTSITVGTGILELPLHQPVLLAKQLASVDQIARGRLVVGVGVGYLALEFAALGVPLDERATRTDEHLEAMRALWTMDAPEYHGQHVDFAGVDAHPRPVQPAVPIVVGGHTAAAYRRAVARGDGWYGFAMTPEIAAASVDGLRKAADEVDRPTALGDLELTITPRGRLTAESAAGFAELGVDRLVIIPNPKDDDVRPSIDGALAAIAG